MNDLTSTMPNYKKKYLMEHTIFVVKEYSFLGLSKIKYINENQTFIVDTKLISNAPIKEKTICIKLLGG